MCIQDAEQKHVAFAGFQVQFLLQSLHYVRVWYIVFCQYCSDSSGLNFRRLQSTYPEKFGTGKLYRWGVHANNLSYHSRLPISKVQLDFYGCPLTIGRPMFKCHWFYRNVLENYWLSFSTCWQNLYSLFYCRDAFSQPTCILIQPSMRNPGSYTSPDVPSFG